MKIDTNELRASSNVYDLGIAADELDRLYAIEEEYKHALTCMDRSCKRCNDNMKNTSTSHPRSPNRNA